MVVFVKFVLKFSETMLSSYVTIKMHSYLTSSGG